MENIIRYELTNYIGHAIIHLRIKMNYTQEDLAGYTGKNEKYIGRIERGEVRNITVDTLTDISFGLKITPSKLVALAEELERNAKTNMKE
ncbi:helix-turn-helix domain-containing protein [Evansella sp. AB-rgal1]|uniref:helix-turn-helix domain-containing protein n=1 Tax=Evansella sp. AB-rgal1 TaxID=3242696 RepID=UPI00359E571F